MPMHLTPGLFTCSSITVQIGWPMYVILQSSYSLLTDLLSDYFLSLSLVLFVYLSGSSVVAMTNHLEDSKQLCFFSFSSFIATLYQRLLHSCALRTLPVLWGFSFHWYTCITHPNTPPVPWWTCSGAVWEHICQQDSLQWPLKGHSPFRSFAINSWWCVLRMKLWEDHSKEFRQENTLCKDAPNVLRDC